MRLSRLNQPRAFSLVEMLVVIGIIALLAVVGATMLGGTAARGTSVQGAVETGVGMVDLARRSAMASQRDSRIVINNDPQSEGYLRQMVVAVAQDLTGTVWEMVSRPRTLPNSTFLLPDSLTGMNSGSFDFRSGTFGVGGPALILEFDVVGNLSPPSGGPASAQLIFAAGVPASTAPFNPDFPTSLSEVRDGFIVRRSGAVVRFEDPSQIQP